MGIRVFWLIITTTSHLDRFILCSLIEHGGRYISTEKLKISRIKKSYKCLDLKREIFDKRNNTDQAKMCSPLWRKPNMLE